MNKFILKISGVLVLVILLVILLQNNKKLKKERDTYKMNTETLLSDVQHYKTKENENAVSVGSLELKLSEYKKHRKEDFEMMKSLKTKNRELERAIKADSKIEHEIQGEVRDSIIYIENNIRDTIRCIDVLEKWFRLNGCINKENQFVGNYKSIDTLSIYETIKRKRFLGFLWKTNRIKDRKVDVVNKNPYIEIQNIEFVTIRK